MFKHILIPYDGSELSMRAARTGIELAKMSQGRVSILHVISPFKTIAYMGAILAATEIAYDQEARNNAERYLADVQAVADAAGVPCQGEAIFGDQPFEIIVQAVTDKQCDLVVMGSHGWRGMTRLLLGSETQKVLLRCDVPVLVCH
ncbi:universal stress protein [Dyella solisilvae]|uniref:Universal stress protein n=1 Tax=Dyella solisilvae TaxID=1920168 RepID=A0A370K9W1_9GAMM|nr:universal stress protein [Dyella solisilvae]RDI99438.1 universal stress protein [Dyella solisilvae]